ncbi:hypothetical protein AB6831_04080 [Carnobacterium divergens]
MPIHYWIFLILLFVATILFALSMMFTGYKYYQENKNIKGFGGKKK